MQEAAPQQDGRGRRARRRRHDDLADADAIDQLLRPAKANTRSKWGRGNYSSDETAETAAAALASCGLCVRSIGGPALPTYLTSTLGNKQYLAGYRLDAETCSGGVGARTPTRPRKTRATILTWTRRISRAPWTASPCGSSRRRPSSPSGVARELEAIESEDSRTS